ncbi:unnamed protein product [Orchesella dallaii]|uniref:Uncharacterized protein n=1 Tax=Orchesella dallaii TaxID=48710 RepID=A0ABP1RJE5_9HEXA
MIIPLFTPPPLLCRANKKKELSGEHGQSNLRSLFIVILLAHPEGLKFQVTLGTLGIFPRKSSRDSLESQNFHPAGFSQSHSFQPPQGSNHRVKYQAEKVGSIGRITFIPSNEVIGTYIVVNSSKLEIIVKYRKDFIAMFANLIRVCLFHSHPSQAGNNSLSSKVSSCFWLPQFVLREYSHFAPAILKENLLKTAVSSSTLQSAHLISINLQG